MIASRVAALVTLALASLSLASAQPHWPQFRGVQASGVAEEAPAPTRWNVASGDNIRWKTSIPGMGHASPIVWGSRAYVVTAVYPGQAEPKLGLYGDIGSANDRGPAQWRLLALDTRSGEIVWNTLGHEGVPRVKRHPKGTHANSTPATDGERIVAIFGSEGLFCFDRSGKLLWRKELGPMDAGYFQSPTAQWGFASSPVIHDGKIVVLCDVLTESFLALFDLADGRELWRTSRKDVPTWGSPTVVNNGAQTLVLVNGWKHTGAYDFATGEEVWKLSGGGDIPVPTPIVGHGFGYFTSAHGRFRPMRAIRLDARGDITPPDPGERTPAIAWTHARQGNYMQTPILVENLLFACSDSGILTCFDARTGAIHYSERLGKGGQGFTASPVSDGRHLFFASESGQVSVVPVSEKFSVVATNELGEPCMATPALSQGTLLFRTQGKLIAVGESGSPRAQ